MNGKRPISPRRFTSSTIVFRLQSLLYCYIDKHARKVRKNNTSKYNHALLCLSSDCLVAKQEVCFVYFGVRPWANQFWGESSAMIQWPSHSVGKKHKKKSPCSEVYTPFVPWITSGQMCVTSLPLLKGAFKRYKKKKKVTIKIFDKGPSNPLSEYSHINEIPFWLFLAISKFDAFTTSPKLSQSFCAQQRLHYETSVDSLFKLNRLEQMFITLRRRLEFKKYCV